MIQDMLKHAWEEFSMLIAPALAASLAVMLAVRWLGGQRAGRAASALAVAAGLVVGGYCVTNGVSDQSPPPWLLDQDRPLRAGDLWTVLGWSLERKPDPPEPPANQDDEKPAEPVQDDGPPMPNYPSRYWLLWLAALAMVAELGLGFAPDGLGWAARAFIALLAGRLLTPADLRIDKPWVPWALGLTMVFEWGLLTYLARRWLDGVPAMTLALCFAIGALVLEWANQASRSEYALLAGACLAGPAFISWKWPSDTSPAIALGVVVLPGLMMEFHFDVDQQVPKSSFVLTALAPLALAPCLIPFLSRRGPWLRTALALALPLIPAILGLVWAIQSGPPPVHE